MKNQKKVLRELFEAHPHQEVSLLQILNTHVAQYNARIHELRRDGMTIDNRTETIDGEKHSFYTYRPPFVKQKEFAICSATN